jgi:hypothetical protein
MTKPPNAPGTSAKRLSCRDDPAQSQRFIDTAEEVGADDDKALERALKKIGLDRRPPQKDER